MIIVAGTKRSGTSMWMQILIGAGFPAFGDAFPRGWGNQALRQANKDGFYESSLRSGVYYRSNPHPTSGVYLFPEQVTRHAVKIFIPGLVRTDRAYIGRVIATMREWREYEASVKRLYALEASQNPEGPFERPHMDPVLEWWWENFMLVKDISVRRYPVHVQSYGGLLDDPERTVTDVMTWLGDGDAKAACARVKPENRNFARPESTSVEASLAEVFDEFYSVVHERRGLSPAFLGKLNETNVVLQPRVLEEHRRVIVERRKRRVARRAAAAEGGLDVAMPLTPAELEELEDDPDEE